ncbi:MAG: sigma-54 interaction domain-containing protein [Terriglobia bacterium]
MKSLEEHATTAGRALIIASPNEELCTHIWESCARQEWQVESTRGGAHALFLLKQKHYQLLLLDLRLRDLDIHEVISMAGSLYPAMQILVFDSETGRFDFSKATPRDCLSEDHVRLLEILGTFKQPVQVWQGTTLECSPEDEREELLPCMVGRSTAMKRIAQLVKLVAPRSTAVLLNGESGTGKELVAKAIHNLGPRSANPFVVVNCAAIPEALFESELFGYNRGAFTGAVESRLGRIHAAHGGTLFLDEIGELPLTMQAKLLRFLQEGEVQRLGSHDIFRVDVRVIAATNSDLIELVSRRQFREDLFYRLTVFPIELDPLRNRREDIGPLSEFFLAALSTESGDPKKTLSLGALTILQANDWRGNVRELQHAIERAFILANNSQVILPEHLRLLPSPRVPERQHLDERSTRPRESGGSFEYAEVSQFDSVAASLPRRVAA